MTRTIITPTALRAIESVEWRGLPIVALAGITDLKAHNTRVAFTREQSYRCR